MARSINQAGIDLIKEFEGCRLKAYRDIVGVLTIGYGHTGKDVVEGLEIDPEQANSLLVNDLAHFSDEVSFMLEVQVSDDMFAALVSFCYNLGAHNLESSTLLKKLNNHDYKGAANEFPRWDRAGGKEIPGLKTRRMAEQTLFLRDLSS